MKAMMKDRSWSSEISFIIAHSKVATCRYNQELSSENRPRCDNQGVERDESSNDEEEDTVEATNKSDNEYEEVIRRTDDPPSASLTNTSLLSLVNYEKETTSDLPKPPNARKLGTSWPFK